jgi:hypothetical protein
MPFFKASTGRCVTIANAKPRNLSGGGLIRWENFNTDEKEEDCIMSNLEDGDVVIPRSVVPLLKDYKGPITGPKQMNSKKWLPTIVQPEEVVVHKKYADKVLRFLKSKGVSLPLTDDSGVI